MTILLLMKGINFGARNFAIIVATFTHKASSKYMFSTIVSQQNGTSKKRKKIIDGFIFFVLISDHISICFA
jgi:hypothetical protein